MPPATPTLYKCPECDWTGSLDTIDGLCNLRQIDERILVGELVPAGACPECRALIQCDDADVPDYTLNNCVRILRQRGWSITTPGAQPTDWRAWLPAGAEGWQDGFNVSRSAKAPEILSVRIYGKEMQMYEAEFAYLLHLMLAFVNTDSAPPRATESDSAQAWQDLHRRSLDVLEGLDGMANQLPGAMPARARKLHDALKRLETIGAVPPATETAKPPADEDTVAEWVGLHYKVNYATCTAAEQADWRTRYAEFTLSAGD